jgi:hypothetical protein
VQRYIGAADAGNDDGTGDAFEFSLVTSIRTYVLAVDTEERLLTWKRLLLFAGELCWECGQKCVPSVDATGAEQYGPDTFRAPLSFASLFRTRVCVCMYVCVCVCVCFVCVCMCVCCDENLFLSEVILTLSALS